MNWGRNVTSRPGHFVQPRSVDEVVDEVNAVRARSGHLRVVGAGHSWSAVAASADCMMNIDHINQIGPVDASKDQVTVGAGVRLKDLIPALREQGYALANVGSVTEQSLAGATSTGTHGTGVQFGNLATQIAALELVDGTGEVRRLARGDDEFDAAALSLGMLGVLTSITLDVVPHYNIREETFAIPFGEALERADELIHRSERVKFWWLPYTGVVQVFVYTTTPEPARPRSATADRIDELVNDHVFDAVLRAGNKVPGMVPLVNRIIGKAYFGEGARVDRWDRLLTLAMPPVHLENEYGVPIENTVDVMRDVHDFVTRDRMAVSFINEVRFVKADNLWLSGSHGRDSCQFGAYTTDNRDAPRFMAGVEDIVYPLGARPHWGKDFAADRSYLASVYPKFEEFRGVRAKYDPDNVFANAFVLRHFGDHP